MGKMDEYLEALDDFLRPLKNSPCYESIRMSYLNPERFSYWVGWIERYAALDDALVLDFGCGSGGLLLALEARGARGIGVEVDRKLCDLAKMQCKSDIFFTDGKELPFPDEYFDVCMSIHVLEHVIDLELYIKELCRVLKPGCIGLIECPNRFYPIEAHTNLPILPIIPKKLTDTISRQAYGKISPGLEMKLRGLEHLPNYISYFKLKNLLSGVKILEFNPTQRFLAENGWTTAHENLFRAFALMFSKSHLVIFKKEK